MVINPGRGIGCGHMDATRKKREDVSERNLAKNFFFGLGDEKGTDQDALGHMRDRVL